MTHASKYTFDQNRSFIAKWCARRERAPLEVRRKLLSRGMEPDRVDEVLGTLVEGGFVDERRFASSYVRDKYRLNKWGRFKIAMGLRQFQIADTHINAALDEIDTEEYLTNLKYLYDKKVAALGEGEPWQNKRKLMEFLMAKGYTADDIAALPKTPS